MAAHQPVIYLHIGAMKTGTTYLQGLMAANADALRDVGYLYPGHRGRYSQTLAARDVLNMTGDPVTLQKARGEWDRIRDEMLGFEGNASVFSKEFLSFAREDLAGKVVDSLEGRQVHGILTVRDATATVPAQWQQAMQSKNTTSWAQFVDQITAEPPKAGTWGAKTFRRTQDIPRMLNAWLAHIPPERFTVVTVPKPGSPRRLLWERFAETIGLDPATASRPAPQRNESIGAASAELVRRLNEQLIDLHVSDYRATMTHTLSARILSDLAPSETRAPTSAAFGEFVANVNERTRAAIESHGVRLVGDLDDLPTEIPRGLDKGELPSPDESEVLTAAAHALPRMLTVVSSRAKTLRQAGKNIDASEVLAELPAGPDETTTRTRWEMAHDPGSVAVNELAQVCRTAIDLGCRPRDIP